MKPAYGSLRNGSVDSNLQLCGSRWGAADTAVAIQSSLSFQKKRSYLWGREGDEYQSTGIPPLAIEGRNDPLLVEGRNQREQDVDSAALETARLKDKLKRKLSEGTGTKEVPPDGASSPGIPLKPAVPRSASHRLLNATVPVPPIPRSPQRSPIQQTTGWAENSTANSENTEILMVPDGVEDQTGRSRSAEQLQQAPTYNAHHVGAKKRTTLSGTVIPPIAKSSGMVSDIKQQDTQMDTREIPKQQQCNMQQRLIYSRSYCFTILVIPFLESRCIESTPQKDQTEDRVTKDCGYAVEGALTNPVTFSLARDVPGEEVKEFTGRTYFSISKSAQDKVRQKQLEMENILQSKRRGQQNPWNRLDYPPASSVGLSGFSTVPPSSDKQRTPIGFSVNKFVSRTSLPSIPTLNQDSNSSEIRHASAYSLPAYFQDCLDWDSDSENGGQTIGPMSHPEQGMIEALRNLSNKDWEQKEKGLVSIKCLCSCHPDVLYYRLHDVATSVTREVSNLRSKVSRNAIRTLGDLFKTLKKNMDPEVEEISRVLLHKIGDSNEFIREESDQSLGIMVENVSPSKALPALIAGGVSHRNRSVRRCAAKHLLGVMEQVGAEKLLSGNKEHTDSLLRTVVKLVQDGQQDARFYGRKMFSLLMGNQRFESQMGRLIPSHDLRELMATIKQKEISDNLCDCVPSAKSQRSTQRNVPVLPQESQTPDQSRPIETVPEPQESPVPRRQPIRTAEVTEQLKELTKLLTAKDFQSKMDGVTLLLEYSKNNHKFVSINITPIFDSFNPRLQDGNKKVNQFALESAAIMIPFLKESLHHVLVPMVTIVTDNLNSKHPGIYSAAVTVLDSLISNIDNLWLLQPFASRIRFISGRAMHDITERLSVLVSSVYPRKPQAVERHVLPVLWYFLSNITGNGVLPGRNGNFKEVVTNLAKTLYTEMGPSLEEYATGQPQHAIKMLGDILGTKNQ
ncbi:hypothetical protein GDO86_009161 [Hymenochirus boettgeri]|uniref:TOG domain-containing protein n=1 Tax=Hymenochirus boettgeri TaxID=247094 RepID=A0A8T2JK58_9PIPI|nr:hypothetical protein GDO86_009161 [Hymenochirus boettgeri]